MITRDEILYGARFETLQRLKKLYPHEYFSGDRGMKTERLIMFRQEFQRLAKHLSTLKIKNGNVLDIGCGEGEFLSLFPNDWKKYGIDISDFALEHAKKQGIITDFELQDDFFDVIIFRGTIQHIPNPIQRIEDCYYRLKKNGLLVFLATPNTNSMYYRLFKTSPMFEESRNFLLPSDIMLKQILNNFGFDVLKFEYPYKETPYANLLKDLIYFILKITHIRKNIQFPFYGSMMECYARKK